MKGAGGTTGGIGRFFIGLIMFFSGSYLFFNAIQVTNNMHFGIGFGRGYGLFSVGNISITSGFILIPFMFGVGMIFFNSKNYFGWLLVILSLSALVFGIITNINFRLRPMTAFELITILVMMIGGLGLFLSSFKSYEK